MSRSQNPAKISSISSLPKSSSLHDNEHRYRTSSPTPLKDALANRQSEDENLDTPKKKSSPELPSSLSSALVSHVETGVVDVANPCSATGSSVQHWQSNVMYSALIVASAALDGASVVVNVVVKVVCSRSMYAVASVMVSSRLSLHRC